MKTWHKLLPFSISLGLIVWLICRISPGGLLHAATLLPWRLLAPMTLGLVVVLYLWDVVCLLTVYSDENRRLTYLQMLRIRGRSYLVGAFNQGLGQAAVAWEAARIQESSFIAALSRSVLLGWHEGVLLAAAALGGSLWIDRPEIASLRFFCAVFLFFLLSGALLIYFLPRSRRRRSAAHAMGRLAQFVDVAPLFPFDSLAPAYFAVVGVYVFLALQICKVPVQPAAALTLIPLVLLASVLPSASGLGTRETALCLLFQPAPADVLLAFGLIWSSGVIVVRLAIGLAWLWYGKSPHELPKSGRSAASKDGTNDFAPLVSTEGNTAPLVVFLDRAGPGNLSRMGGKGANLARLLEAGLPVPGGFCVTTDAFERQIASLENSEEFRALLADSHSESGEEPLSLGARLRARLAAAPLLPSIEQAIAAAWQEHGPSLAYVVRSSAVEEDGARASFAGQGETFFNVRGRREILDRVRDCWISLFADRAILYRKRQGDRCRNAAMAVVVQEMILAEAAGVLFTTEPADGDAGRMVIEGSYGLGQSLVSGEVSPDRIVLAKPGLHVLEYHLGDKLFETLPDDASGTRKRPVAPDRAKSACLDATGVERLGALALQAERLLDGPQDIEWAVAKRRIFLLQSRPITAMKPKAEEPRTVWSNMNSWEVLPGVVAPMSWSLVDSYFKSMFRPVLRVLGIDIDKQPLFGLVAGRAYANVGTFAAIARALPLPGLLDFVRGLGGRDGRELIERLPSRGAKGWTANMLGVFRLSRMAIWAVAHAADQRSKRDLERFRRRLDELFSPRLDMQSETELINRLGALLRRNRQFGPDLAADVAVAVGFVSFFYRFLKSRLGREGDAVANRLLEGLGGLASAEAGLELWELAVWVRQRPELASAVSEAVDFPSLRQRLNGGREFQEFLERWERFLLRHGHHACGEFDARTPRWSETPDHVLDMLRGYLENPAETIPGEFRRRLARQRAALADECRRRFEGPFDSFLFDYLLRKAQFGVASVKTRETRSCACWASQGRR